MADIVTIAKVCHEANREYCNSIGDYSQVGWFYAPEWQKNSAIAGVKFHLANPWAPFSASHNNWMDQKAAEGWRYGETKDPDKKEHPYMVPYEKLPPEQKFKDVMFTCIVRAMTSYAAGF